MSVAAGRLAVRGHRLPRHPRRARAQPQEHHARAPARPADRLHGPVRLGEVLARLRHDLRRGPAALRGVAVRVRAAVPGADGEARRRLHRGPLAGHLDRPEVHLAQPALHGRHDHRGLRLPAGALRAGRAPALLQLRPPDRSPDPRADRRPGDGAARGHEVPGARADRPRAQGRVRQAPRRAGPQGVSRARGSTARSATSPSRSGWPRPTSTRSRSWSTGWSPSPTSAGASPTRSSRRSSSPRASPRSPSSTHEGHEEIQTFSQKLACTYCGLSFDELAPRNFSFNSPYGACQTCDGLGTRLEVDPELVVPDPDLSVNEGALAPWASATLEYWYRVLEAVADDPRVRPRHPVEEAAEGARARSCCTAPTSRSTSATRTGTGASARTGRRTRARSPTSSDGTPRPTPTPRATGSSSSCARSRAGRARARACGPRRSPSRSAGITSPE